MPHFTALAAVITAMAAAAPRAGAAPPPSTVAAADSGTPAWRPMQAVEALAGEEPRRVIFGISAWANALTQTALGGGGSPDDTLPAWGTSVPFDDPRSAEMVRRLAVDLLAVVCGPRLIPHREADAPGLSGVTVADCRRDRDIVELGQLAVRALLAEARQAGAGRIHVSRITAGGLEGLIDGAFVAEVCMVGDQPSHCLYQYVADLGERIRVGRRAAPALAPSDGAGGCEGDLDESAEVDIEDLRILLARWGEHDDEAADLDGSGAVDREDLLTVLLEIGRCGR